MTRTIRNFLFVEALSFTIASLIHAGILIRGYQHHEAHLAEAVIATVLIVGLVLTWLRPIWVRAIGLVTQGFALLRTLVGILTIAIGVGPRTAPDVIYHLAIVAVLIWGLTLTRRTEG